MHDRYRAPSWWQCIISVIVVGTRIVLDSPRSCTRGCNYLLATSLPVRFVRIADERMRLTRRSAGEILWWNSRLQRRPAAAIFRKVNFLRVVSRRTKIESIDRVWETGREAIASIGVTRRKRNQCTAKCTIPVNCGVCVCVHDNGTLYPRYNSSQKKKKGISTCRNV